MPRHAYSSKDAELWARRVHLGESYRAIALEAGVDPRTVKLAVDRLRAATERDRWEAIRQMLDAEALRQHTGQVIALAEQVRSLVDLNPLVGIGRALKASDPDQLVAGKTILIDGQVTGMRLTPDMPAARQALLLRDLWGHVPALRGALERWRQNLARFIGLRARLNQALQRIDGQIEPGDRAALAQQVLEAVCLPPDEESAGLRPGIADSLLRLREAEQAAVCYRKLEQAVGAVHETVDLLVLRGTLTGACQVFSSDLPTLETPEPASAPDQTKRPSVGASGDDTAGRTSGRGHSRTRRPEVSA